MNWYYVEAGQQRGPVTDAELPGLIASGTISDQTLVWHEAMVNWQPYSEVGKVAVPLQPLLPTGDLPGRGGSTAAASVAQAVCSECHRLVPREFVLSFGPQLICVYCKPVFIQQLKEGVTPVKPRGQIHAGFWLRFGAYFIDQLILSVAIFFLVLPIILIMPSKPLHMRMLQQSIIFFVQVAVGLAYESWFLVRYGATPGKMALRLKVIWVEDGQVSWGRAIGRFMAKTICGCPTLYIGFVIAGFDEEKRALHDRVCNTRVIQS